MLKYFIGIALVVWLIGAAVGHQGEVDAQAARNSQQTTALLALEDLHDAGVSHLVDEWRDEHPEPSAHDLEELQILASRVKGDPRSASRYSAEAKRARDDALPFESVFGPVKETVGLAGAVPAAASAAASTAGK
jgi:hypothetical protein